MRRLIVSFAVLCAIAPLILYLLFFVGEQKVTMRAEADIFARTITDEINNNPAYWQYEDIRFASILRRRLPDGHNQEHRQLFDSNNILVAENKASLPAPLIHVEVPVFDAGAAVGILKITRSIRSILETSVLVFLVSSLCGTLVYFLLRVFPLKVLRSAFVALHEEKEQATVTLQAISDAVVTTDTSLRILSLNPAATELVGMQTSRVIGGLFSDYFEILHPETREKIDDLLDNCLAAVDTFCSLPRQALIVGKGESSNLHVEITVSALRDEQASLLGLVIVFHNVTIARALEKQLQDKVTELAVIVKYAGVGIAFVQHGAIREANTMVSEIMGVPPEAIIGQEVSYILPTYLGYTEPIEYIYEQLGKGDIFDIEYQVVRSDQRRIWLRLIGQAVDPSRLSEAGSVWIAQDITQLKQYQEELRMAKRLAEEASNFKSEFIAHVNHELRNPIGGIIGLNRLVLESELTPVQQQQLTIVQTTAENLLLLINNLLDLSKIEAGVMELEEKPFNIASTYDYVHNVVALRVKEKGLFLTLSIADDVPSEVIGDELRLGQLLLNLVGNALKFTSTGGITVSCEKLSQTENTIQLQFSVTDTGCGIDEPTRKKIFKAFVQASSSVARTHGGSGLGLSICKKIVKLMGGDIVVESEPGKGSTFSFTGNFRHELRPETGSAVADKIIPKDKEGLPQRARKILLVEDMAFNQTLAKSLLEGGGHRVQVAANGREALAALAVSTFDAIFMDVQMPVMDGLLATRLIRRCEKEEIPLARESTELLRAVNSRIYGKHIPIIGMTGNTANDHRQDCLAAGMDRYITKPFERDEMLGVLNVLCEKPTL